MATISFGGLGNGVDFGQVVTQLERFRNEPLAKSLAAGRYFESLLERARTAGRMSRHEVVELQRDVSEMSLTGHIFSRTRKVDAMPDRPPRRPGPGRRASATGPGPRLRAMGRPDTPASPKGTRDGTPLTRRTRTGNVAA